VFEVMGQVMSQEGEAQAKSVEEARKRFKVLDEGLKKHFPNKNIRRNDDVGLLEITIIATLGGYKAHREAIGVDIIGPVNTPTLYNWIERLQDLSVIKEVEVPHDTLVTFIQKYRQKCLQQAANA
jgi:glutathione S-transferase